MSKIREKIIWYRMKRLAAAHPFFHRKNGLLSMREAKTLLREKEIPDGQEVVRRARIELGIPEPVSSATISSGKTLFSTVSRGRYFVLRRGLICLSVLLIVFGLFTMTEAGTAFSLIKFSGKHLYPLGRFKQISTSSAMSVLPANRIKPSLISSLYTVNLRTDIVLALLIEDRKSSPGII